MTTEESKDSVKKQHPAQPKTLDEIYSKFTEEDKDNVSEMYNAEVGFTRVIQMLIDAKKPLVAHNPQFDVAFLFE